MHNKISFTSVLRKKANSKIELPQPQTLKGFFTQFLDFPQKQYTWKARTQENIDNNIFHSKGAPTPSDHLPFDNWIKMQSNPKNGQQGDHKKGSHRSKEKLDINKANIEPVHIVNIEPLHKDKVEPIHNKEPFHKVNNAPFQKASNEPKVNNEPIHKTSSQSHLEKVAIAQHGLVTTQSPKSIFRHSPQQQPINSHKNQEEVAVEQQELKESLEELLAELTNEVTSEIRNRAEQIINKHGVGETELKSSKEGKKKQIQLKKKTEGQEESEKVRFQNAKLEINKLLKTINDRNQGKISNQPRLQQLHQLKSQQRNGRSPKSSLDQLYLPEIKETVAWKKEDQIQTENGNILQNISFEQENVHKFSHHKGDNLTTPTEIKQIESIHYQSSLNNGNEQKQSQKNNQKQMDSKQLSFYHVSDTAVFGNPAELAKQLKQEGWDMKDPFAALQSEIRGKQDERGGINLDSLTLMIDEIMPERHPKSPNECIRIQQYSADKHASYKHMSDNKENRCLQTAQLDIKINILTVEKVDNPKIEHQKIENQKVEPSKSGPPKQQEPEDENFQFDLNVF